MSLARRVEALEARNPAGARQSPLVVIVTGRGREPSRAHVAGQVLARREGEALAAFTERASVAATQHLADTGGYVALVGMV